MDKLDKKIAQYNGMKFNLRPVYEYKVVPEFTSINGYTLKVKGNTYTTNPINKPKYQEYELTGSENSIKNREPLEKTYQAKEIIIPIYWDDPTEDETEREEYVKSAINLETQFLNNYYKLRLTGFKIVSKKKLEYYKEHEYKPLEV